MEMETHLSSIRPRQGTPTKLINRIGQENHRNSRDTRGCNLRLGLWSRIIDDSNTNKANRHQDSGNPQRRFTPPHLREEEDVDTDCDELLRTEQTSNE